MPSAVSPEVGVGADVDCAREAAALEVGFGWCGG